MDSNLVDSRAYDLPAVPGPFAMPMSMPKLAELFFPPEIQKTLDSKFLGMRLWLVILLALILPIPKFVIPILLIMIFPGVKDRLRNMIRNGSPSPSPNS
jgi:hypothetical protein